MICITHVYLSRQTLCHLRLMSNELSRDYLFFFSRFRKLIARHVNLLDSLKTWLSNWLCVRWMKRPIIPLDKGFRSFVVSNFLMTGPDFGVTDDQHSVIWRIIYIVALCRDTRTRMGT